METPNLIPAGLDPNQIKALYTKAADVLRTYGWTQGKFGDCSKGFCAYGALGKANSDLYSGSVWSIGSKANPLRSFVGSSDSGSIAAWNDNPLRTKEEVIAALETIANQIPSPPTSTPSPLTTGVSP